MRATFHQRASRVFLEALEQPAAMRDAFVRGACEGDAPLEEAVRALLRNHVEDSFLETPPAAPRVDVAGDGELPEPQLPERIGAYRIHGLLGRGGMGAVYDAEQQSPRRRVALKVVSAAFLGEEAVHRFRRESEVLGRLHHPGIAQIIEAGTAERNGARWPFFAMERVDGLRLDEWVQAGPPPVKERLRLFLEVCDAVHHAHQRGVIHRDLKPSNVLVDRSGHARVLDFGIARAVEPDAQATLERTGTGQILGTLSFMSPEQAAGAADLDVRSDVYSLGVILYELLAGQPPYDLSQCPLPAALEKIQRQEPAPLPGHRVLRDDLRTIVWKALEKERERRYPSALELAQDLGRWLRSEPIQARPASKLYHLRKFTRRNRVLVAGAASTFLATLAGLVVALGFYGRSEKLRAEQEGQAALMKAGAQCGELEAELPFLWPRRLTMQGRMEEWLARAAAVAGDLPRHRAFVQGRAGSGDSWTEETLARTLAQVEGFVAGGAASEVQERLAETERIHRATIEDFDLEWTEAIERIAAEPAYGGLRLEPVAGLVPLRQDPASGLFEFWLLESGERPEVDPDTERWAIEDDTGIVLVLLPGGTFWLGRKPPGNGPLRGHAVTLDPFFVSRYEMTQGQWLRAMGSNPSNYQAAWSSFLDGERPLAHPVETVSWAEAMEACRRLGLTLPTEAQWEYAARGGTETRFWTGDDPATLEGAENFAGRELQGFSAGNEDVVPWNDGFVLMSPAGSYRPNPFGLHDVLGNVSELCLDDYFGEAVYQHAPVRAGDGLRLGTIQTRPLTLLRGGNYLVLPERNEVYRRYFRQPQDRDDDTGFRPALNVYEPEPVPGRDG